MKCCRISSSLLTHSYNGEYYWWDPLPEAPLCFPPKLALFYLQYSLKELGIVLLASLVPLITNFSILGTIRHLATTIRVIASRKVTPQSLLGFLKQLVLLVFAKVV